MDDLATVLKRRRGEAGLTQEELAERAGVSARSISDIERGLRSTIYRDTATRLADALGLAGDDRDAFLAISRGRVPAAAAKKTALPVAPTRLVGRDKEVAAIAATLRDESARVVTITGPGGVGKTRVAIEAANETQTAFSDGVFFVPLGGLRDAALVPSVIAQSVGARSTSEPLDAVATALADRHVLVVLDTFEHVLDAAAFVADVVARCARTTVLVASREALRIRGEHEIVLQPLPDDDATRLFVERARAVKPDLPLDPDAIAAIAARLQGIPLALELAAARVRHVALDDLDRELSLSVLTGGARDLPERQRTMRDTISWSYDLLTQTEKDVFARLSVFAGGWTLDAARAVADADLGTLGALVDKSLVSMTAGRYALLDVIREFASSVCRDAGVQRSHAGFFLALAEELGPDLMGTGQAAAGERLSAEHDNLRAALRWSLDAGEHTTALRIAGAIWPFWRARGYVVEGRAWLREALAHAADDDPTARAMRGAAWLAYHQADYREVEDLAVRYLALARRTKDPLHTRNALTVRGMVAMANGRFEEAIPSFDEAITICRTLGRDWDLATSFLNLSHAAMHAGDIARARDALREARSIYVEIGDRHFAARALAYDGWALGLSGDPAGARDAFTEALRAFVALDDVAGTAECLEGLASFAEDDIDAARLAGRAGMLRESGGTHPLPFDAAAMERLLAPTRASLGEPGWRAAMADGATQPLERDIARV